MSNFKQIALLLLGTVTLTLGAQAQAYFSGDRLRQAVVAYAEKTAGKDAEVLVAHSIADQGFQESGVSAKCSATKESLRGVSNVVIEFSIAGRVVRRVPVPVQVKIFRNVAVATSAIGYASAISGEQFTIERRDVTAYADKDLLSRDEILGATARRTIQKGGIITRSSITEAGGVRRGMVADIMVQSGSVIIRTRGSVLNDAMPGEAVRIMRLGTNSILTGILQENHTVFIGSPGATLSERE